MGPEGQEAARREYIVYRHGWNETNQRRADGLPERMPVLRVQADSPEEACRLAAQSVRVEPGQRLSAEPADAVDAHENDIDRKAEALERAPEAE
jgi:hypothetical protein